MKEIRLHGRGGQGLVKAGQIAVQAAVDAGKNAAFIPFFGVERKGSPVYGFLRLDDKPIRPKTQVYNPDCVIVLDDTLLDEVDVFEGIKDDSILIINTRSLKNLKVPDKISTIGVVDASEIALKHLKKNIPNTTILGTFCRVTGWLPLEEIKRSVEAQFGELNGQACVEGYNNANVITVR